MMCSFYKVSVSYWVCNLVPCLQGRYTGNPLQHYCSVLIGDMCAFPLDTHQYLKHINSSCLTKQLKGLTLFSDLTILLQLHVITQQQTGNYVEMVTVYLEILFISSCLERLQKMSTTGQLLCGLRLKLVASQHEAGEREPPYCNLVH